MNNFTEKQVRSAIRSIQNDPRLKATNGLDRIGTSFEWLNESRVSGLGYQYPHTRTVRSKLKINDNDEGYFLSLEVNGVTTNVRLGLKEDASYAEIANAIEQFTEIK